MLLTAKYVKRFAEKESDSANTQTPPKIQVFPNDEFGQIRAILINGDPWFVGKDVAAALGYEKARNAIASHVDDEDALKWGVLTQGGKQEMTIINESGLYSLIFGSRLESAKRFKHWVTSEVLPAIRKTGGYVNNDDLFVNTYLPFADENTKILFKTTLNVVKSQNELIRKQNKEIEQKDLEINHKGKELSYKSEVIDGLVKNVGLADKRQILNRIIRYQGGNYDKRWHILYREFNNKFHINITRQMKSYNEQAEEGKRYKRKIDFVDRHLHQLNDLYELAVKIFEYDYDALVHEMYDINNNIKG